jgi:argininosuccinate lyase
VVLLIGLLEKLVGRADGVREAIIPGYTHLQRAQPVTLAQHLLAHAFALERDTQRLLDALARADASPLGAGALAGSSLPLSPEISAQELGFGSVMPSTLDAVAARDFLAEFLAAAAILGVHLSRIGEEIVLWTSAEFGFARLADAYATGSSLMPQKKNPDIAELARGKTGRLIGNSTSVLVTLKGLPLAYNRDLQEDKEPLFDTVRTLRTMLPAMTGMLATIAFDTERMRAAVTPEMLATALAESLVRDGVPFRDAHEAVGSLVRAAADAGVALTDLDPGQVKAVTELVDPALVADLAPHVSTVDEEFDRARATLDALRARVLPH